MKLAASILLALAAPAAAGQLEGIKSQEFNAPAAAVLKSAAEFAAARADEPKGKPKTKGTVTLTAPEPLEFSWTIPDHGGSYYTITGRLSHGDKDAATLKVKNLTLEKEPALEIDAKAGEAKALEFRHEVDDRSGKGLAVRSGVNKIRVETLRGGKVVSSETFEVTADLDERY